MPALRLDKIISDTGLFSRSEAHALIRGGRVTAGGCPVRNAAQRFDPERGIITIDGAPLEYKKFRYFMMNKPEGYVSSTSDRREKTVVDLLGEEHKKLGLFPAGRLDKDATGLLLLTNDGEFAHKITSPLNRVDKRYFVQTDGPVTETEIETFAQGLELRHGLKCQPAILENTPGGVFVTVHEGKYHQVKRMMAALGKRVEQLKRVSIGGLQLDESLKPGKYRELNDEIRLILASDS